MKTWLCAIGGGEIGRPGKEIETYHNDRRILEKINKIKPKILFIPTASNDSDSYCEVFKNYFEKKHGCDVNFLFLLKNKILYPEIKSKIFSSDIIYIGGGDTVLLFEEFKKNNLKPLLIEALKKGIMIWGFSAGAILLFEKGISEKEGLLKKIDGLNLINGVFCPHSNKKNINDIVKVLSEGEIVILSEDSTAFLISSENEIEKLEETEKNKINIMMKKDQTLIEVGTNILKFKKS